jgi:hypothetical protein
MAEAPDKPAAAPAPTPPAPEPKSHRRHRLLVGSLLALASIIAVFAVMALWVNRQALNTDNVTNTSSQILADKQVQTALGAYLVNQVFSSVDVEAQLKSQLPSQIQGLAGPVAGGLQQVATVAAPKLLARPRVQSAFKTSVHAAHEQLMTIINGGGKAVSTKNGVVTLNLHELVAELGATLGIGNQVAAAQQKLQGSAGAAARTAAQQKLGITLPPSSGQLVLMKSSQLKFAQDVAGAIKGFAIVFPVLAVLLFALAVWLAQGWRRIALRSAGWCFLGIGLVVLIVRRVAGNAIVDNLVKVQSNKGAVHQIWTIGTTLLYDIAIAMVVYGIALVIAAWFGGRTRPATAVRRALAPTLRDHPVRAYGGAALLLLILVIWGITPAMRQVIPVVLFAALLALGVHLLQRRTAAEFPDAREGDTMRSLRGWYAARRQPQPVTAPLGNGQHVSEIERLAALHDRGVLSDAEFAAEKAQIIKPG